MGLAKFFLLLYFLAGQAYAEEIFLQDVHSTEQGGFELEFESTHHFLTKVEDPDGRLLLLASYSILLETYTEKLFRGDEKWERIRNLQINDFPKMRPLFRMAIQRYLKAHKDSPAAKELQDLLKQPWMSAGAPGLNDFVNKTLGTWLATELKSLKLSFYSQITPKKGASYEERKTLLVFSQKPRDAVNAYFGSRPLTLPPSEVARRRSSMKLGPKVQRMIASLQRY